MQPVRHLHFPSSPHILSLFFFFSLSLSFFFFFFLSQVIALLLSLPSSLLLTLSLPPPSSSHTQANALTHSPFHSPPRHTHSISLVLSSLSHSYLPLTFLISFSQASLFSRTHFFFFFFLHITDIWFSYL